MRKYEGVIFDLDGVICFTDHYHYLAWKALADSLGIDFDETKNDRLRGVSRMESLEIVLAGFFDAVSDGNNIQRSKPDPQVFTMAAEMLRPDPGKCLVVEDALAGLQAAAAGGFDSAGLGPAAESGKATYSLSSFRGLLEVV